MLLSGASWQTNSVRVVVPNLFGTRDQFHERQFFHRMGAGGWGMFSRWFKCITFIMLFIPQIRHYILELGDLCFRVPWITRRKPWAQFRMVCNFSCPGSTVWSISAVSVSFPLLTLSTGKGFRFPPGSPSMERRSEPLKYGFHLDRPPTAWLVGTHTGARGRLFVCETVLWKLPLPFIPPWLPAVRSRISTWQPRPVRSSFHRAVSFSI